MWLTGLVVPRPVGSSQTRARTRVPCISRQILNHRATREAPVFCNLEDQILQRLSKEPTLILLLRGRAGTQTQVLEYLEKNKEKIPSCRFLFRNNIYIFGLGSSNFMEVIFSSNHMNCTQLVIITEIFRCQF